MGGGPGPGPVDSGLRVGAGGARAPLARGHTRGALGSARTDLRCATTAPAPAPAEASDVERAARPAEVGARDGQEIGASSAGRARTTGKRQQQRGGVGRVVWEHYDSFIPLSK